jgi:drug/metabolite transporter (DMT)-like permease
MTSGANRSAPEVPDSITPWAVLLFIGVIWGVTFSLAKLVTEAGAHPLGVSWWQAVIGGALACGYCIVRKRMPSFSARHIAFYIVCGILGTAVPGTMFFYAAPHIPAGVISITIATVPMLTFALAMPLGLEHFDAKRLIGIVLGIVSVLLIVGPETSLPDPGMTFWVLMCIIGSACYALENLWISVKRPKGSDAFTILAGMLLAAALMLLPVVVVVDAFVPLSSTPGIIEYGTLGMAVINTVSYGLFIFLVTTAGPVFASQTAYLVTLSGILWGIAIFSEQHSWWIWTALLVMLAGLALVRPRT